MPLQEEWANNYGGVWKAVPEPCTGRLQGHLVETLQRRRCKGMDQCVGHH